MEYFDVCDEQGNPTGKTVERKTAHREGIHHRTAHIWVVRNYGGRKQILLQKRSQNKDSFPGRFDTSSAGHVTAGDEPLTSAIRELKEELGIEAEERDLSFAGTFPIHYEMEFYGEPFRDSETAFVYVYEKPVNLLDLTLQKEEVETAAWFDLLETEAAIEAHDKTFCVPIDGLRTLIRYLENRIRILPVGPEDAEELLGIYRPYVEQTAITFEYEVPSVEEFRQRIAHTLERYPYIKAMMGNRIVGYGYAGAFKGRKAYDWSVETSIYTSMDVRKKGVGKAIYHALEEILRRMNVINLNACIAYPAQEDAYLSRNSAEFHEHMGYRMAGRFSQCGYKFGRWYDMVWMEKMLGEHPEVPSPVKSFSEIAGELGDYAADGWKL